MSHVGVPAELVLERVDGHNLTVKLQSNRRVVRNTNRIGTGTSFVQSPTHQDNWRLQPSVSQQIEGRRAG